MPTETGTGRNVPSAACGVQVGMDQVYARWPALRGIEEQPVIDAIPGMR